jgi:hypothetical protein
MLVGDYGWGVGARLIATLSGGQVIGSGPSSSSPTSIRKDTEPQERGNAAWIKLNARVYTNTLHLHQ